MDTDQLISTIVTPLTAVPGLCAVVLGGSRARGTETSTSDFDLGLYYHPDRPLDVAALDRVAAALDDRRHPGLVTSLGEWGPWINGGGWLRIRGQPVDWLYRDLARVEAVLGACLNGQVEMAYQPGHPHGFVSSIYLAEVAVCQPLWDGDGRLAALKRQVEVYPEALRRALIQKFAWEIDFALANAQASAARADVTYVAGCCFRAVACLLQVLFALNRRHWLNEKGALTVADAFLLRPVDLRWRVEGALAALSREVPALEWALAELNALSREAAALIVDV